MAAEPLWGINEDIKKRVGWLAYALSGLKSLMFPAMKVEISVDGAEFTKHRARTVVVVMIRILSSQALARSFPSGLKATDLTYPVCPSNFCNTSPVSASQTRAVLS